MYNLRAACVLEVAVLLSLPLPAPLKAVTVNVYDVLGVRLFIVVKTPVSLLIASIAGMCTVALSEKSLS